MDVKRETQNQEDKTRLCLLHLKPFKKQKTKCPNFTLNSFFPAAMALIHVSHPSAEQASKSKREMFACLPLLEILGAGEGGRCQTHN